MQSHSCPHILDDYVINRLQSILGFFGKTIPRYFPQTIQNIPGEHFSRIQIYSLRDGVSGNYRIKRAITDLDYFENIYIP